MNFLLKHIDTLYHICFKALNSKIKILIKGFKPTAEALIVFTGILFYYYYSAIFSTRATGHSFNAIFMKFYTQIELKRYIGPLKIWKLSGQGLRGDN